MIFVGVMGHGTVGSGVVEVLQKNVNSISKRAGVELQVKKILDLRDFPELSYSHLFTKDVGDILGDPEISIVVEVMGGINPAYSFTKRALELGKHVVTSNKELVAQHGAKLQRIAWNNNVNYLFEASVGGGIPIIRPLKQCLAGNDILEISGILNGTTNYILSEMKNKGKGFEEALSDAQARGYAERDPSADIEGYDAQRKIAILSSIAFQQQILFSDIQTEGITSITKEDIAYADELGYVIKLVAYAVKAKEGIWARVSPVMLPSDHPLSDVVDVFNAIMVKGDAIGDVMFYGRGAGKLPTASAIVGDIIDSARHMDGMKIDVPPDEAYIDLLSTDHIENRYAIRIRVRDEDKVKSEIEALMPNAHIHVSNNPILKNEVVILTETINELDCKQMRKALDALSSVEAIVQTLRIVESL